MKTFGSLLQLDQIRTRCIIILGLSIEKCSSLVLSGFHNVFFYQIYQNMCNVNNGNGVFPELFLLVKKCMTISLNICTMSTEC